MVWNFTLERVQNPEKLAEHLENDNEWSKDEKLTWRHLLWRQGRSIFPYSPLDFVLRSYLDLHFNEDSRLRP